VKSLVLTLIDVFLLAVFLSFYVGLFYNLPVLAAGVRDLRKSKRAFAKRTPNNLAHLPSFSVILPVTNERKTVGRILEAISRLDYPSEKLEVVIIDDSSTDGTTEACALFAALHSNFKLLRRDSLLGKANALNYGLENSSGDIIAVFDADNVPQEDVLVRAAEHFEDPSVAALQGRIQSINAGESMLTQFIAYEDAVWCEAFLRGKEKLGLFVHLRGSCEFIRRDVLKSIGGFDEDMLAEDIEMSTHLIEHGHRIKYAGNICTWQESPSRIKSFLKQRTRWYRGHMEVALKYGRLLKHLNRMTLDAEFTLCLPFVTIASFFLFTFASWGVFAALQLNTVLMICMVFSTSATLILFLLAGLVLIYYSKPRSAKNLLWLPFIFGYSFLQSFLAVYAGLLILLRRPKKWTKTEKSGNLSNPCFSSGGKTRSSPLEHRRALFSNSEDEIG
jgi:cellulose synthase/poly-beta-1,6-N-acetylglucosamine synthase-like glycosyltransferase